MIKRYSKKAITKLFTDEARYGAWLKVELAILRARVDLGTLERDSHEEIEERAKFNCQRIEEIEVDLGHDLLSFVQCVQEEIGEHRLAKYFHESITSYDTEEPATAIIIIEAIHVIIDALHRLGISLKEKAVLYKYLLKIHRTHGQHAQPVTFGLELLWWFDALDRQIEKLEGVAKDMEYSKISGGVGTYGTGLSPELESKALEYLGLKPARISAQIILRDRHCRVLNELAILASLLEHIAINIRLYGQTEIDEVKEPFGKKQKGSSYMPHKRNNILTENVCGMATLVRGYAGMLMEKIPTWGARDIAHSSIERVVIPDAFEITNFMLCRMDGVIRGMVVNESQMEKNLNLLNGAIFSPDAKEFLLSKGVDTEKAYRICQRAAFKTIENGTPYKDALEKDTDFPVKLKGSKELEGIFVPKNTLKFIAETFARFGL
ncbi:MAG: adenylosuccinate lyase [Candidatus Moraniibacteriota bacterium]